MIEILKHAGTRMVGDLKLVEGIVGVLSEGVREACLFEPLRLKLGSE